MTATDVGREGLEGTDLGLVSARRFVDGPAEITFGLTPGDRALVAALRHHILAVLVPAPGTTGPDPK